MWVGAASLAVGIVVYNGASTTITPNVGPPETFQASEQDENSDFQAQNVGYKVAQTGTPPDLDRRRLAAWGAVLICFTEAAAGGLVPFPRPRGLDGGLIRDGRSGMSMLVIAGSTNVTTYFHLRLAASGLTRPGLTIANIDLQYVRSGVAPVAKVDATALAATDTAHTDNFGIEIDATDQPGLYRIDWPDAAFAAGVDEVILTVKVATAFTESLRVRLVPVVRGLSGTALPNAAADAAGGLPISDAGGLDLDAKLANTNEVTVARMGALTDWINGGRLI